MVWTPKRAIQAKCDGILGEERVCGIFSTLSWDVGEWGQFLRMSPEKDVIDVVNALVRSKKIISLWDEREYIFSAKEIFLCGVSFGGTAVLLAANHPKVKKVIAISPVTDWRVESKIEKLSWMKEALRESFGEAYRYKSADWDKLARGGFFNPIEKVKELPGKKIFILHAEDDLSVPVRTVKAFVKKTRSTFWLRKRGGHFSLAETTRLRTYRRLKKFLAL